MRNKNGFTLAEALITIGIIGVIATLTLPSLTHDIQKQKIGPTLAKAVNSLENANMDLLRETETPNLKLACNLNDSSAGVDYIDCLADKSNLTGTQTYIGENYCIQTKDGIAFCPKSNTLFSANNAPEKYYGEYLELTVDIDPNKEPGDGIDTFDFNVDLKGQLIPVGGAQHTAYQSGEYSTPAWKDTCDKDKLTEKNNCAGSIADNGWKVIYKL